MAVEQRGDSRWQQDRARAQTQVARAVCLDQIARAKVRDAGDRRAVEQRAPMVRLVRGMISSVRQRSSCCW